MIMQGRRKTKFSISFKLAMCFTAAILIIAVLIGSVFTVIFRNYTESLYYDNMKKTARSISSVITRVINESGDSLWKPNIYDHKNEQGVVYLDGPRLIRFVKEITDADVWLIDSSFNILTTAGESDKGYSNQYIFKQLPSYAQKFIKQIFAGSGYEVYGENFSSIIEKQAMTVGVPVFSPTGQVAGAVLMHTPTDGMMKAINSGLLILLSSIALAIFIGVILSAFMSKTIAKPLKKINSAALMLSEGNYSVTTDIKRTDEIGELAATMDEMGAKLQLAEVESSKLQKMRQDFVANVSHELRTPVTVIRSSLEALCDGVVTDTEMVKSYHEQLLRESIYMQRLVNELLDLSRLQNPDFSINIADINLYDCVSDAVRSGRKIAGERNITIDFKHDTTLREITGDYDRIRQMILIMIDNAVKFTSDPSDSVEVVLYDHTVTVTNIGAGIKEEDMPFIFERFYKSRSEQNKNGTGLGLAIAKQIASRHGIGLSVNSVDGGKTTFKFVFPEKI